LKKYLKSDMCASTGETVALLVTAACLKRTHIVADTPVVQANYLVIGAGIAGLSLALKLAEHGSVAVAVKNGLEDSNTWYAQGGIASVLDPTDSFENHVQDTMEAGAGLCHEDVVRMVVREGPRLIRELVEFGAKFDADQSGSLHLTMEGGHSHRRVIHSKDITGRVVAEALIGRVKSHPNIQIFENHSAIDLLTTDKIAPDFTQNDCLGAWFLDRATSRVMRVDSPVTFLCTGGHGKLYLYTSNPDSATGDGLAMAWRAGCRVANLEFMQFHPTCLFHHKAKNFLISEAVRGEGGILKNLRGHSFMEAYHPMGSLAPRDVVARAIDTEIKQSGDPHVWLDVRHLGAQKIKSLFPNIYEICLKFGIDMASDMIPVVPAAHYSCGGLVTDHRGRTNIGHLYAIGEVACTGLHGANRLASNSLLEAMVFADSAAEDVLGRSDLLPRISVNPQWINGELPGPDEQVVLTHAWDEIRRVMWNYVGIVRSEHRLKRALARIENIRQELDDYWWRNRVSNEVLEVRNLAAVAWLTIRSAMTRKESRGIHFMLDWPQTDAHGKDSII
jgi:L-aspartate oxidase